MQAHRRCVHIIMLSIRSIKQYGMVVLCLPTSAQIERLQSGSQRVPAIDRDGLSVEVLVGGNEQQRVSHIPVVTWPLGRHLVLELILRQLRLLVRTTATSSHLRREYTRSDGVDADLDLVLRDLVGQHAGEVDSASLRGVVLRVVLHGLDHAGDGAGVDDGSAVAVAVHGSLLQEWQEAGAHEVAVRDVGAVDVVPVLEAVLVGVEHVLLHLGGVFGFGGDHLVCHDT